MKNHTKLALLFFICTFLPIVANAQVGIGTTTPKAALDVNSTTTGFLMPRIALTSTNTSAPVTNPQGGGLALGTMIFNTNTTAGTYGVVPGLYYWNGTKWVAQFSNKFEAVYSQTTNITVANATTTNIPGLTALSFTAPYDGVYQFIFTGYLGAIQPAMSSAFAWCEGVFKFTVNGVNYDKYSHSMSTAQGSNNLYEAFNETNLRIRIPMLAGATCTMNAAYLASSQEPMTGNGHIVGKLASNLGNLCEISIVYIGR
jgi:hypothetical protein